MVTSSTGLIVTTPSDTEIVMTRVFDAPRALVFEAHSKPEHIRRWWGPRGYTTPITEMDFRPGGAWRFVQRGTDGTEFGFRGEFREIVPPEKIVWTFEFEGMPGHVSVQTLTLEEKDGRTTLTSRLEFPSTEERDGMLHSGMERGASDSMDRLEEHLAVMAGDAPEPELELTRIFDAPRELVWKAWTDPGHFARWFGPRSFTTPHCTIDLRPGGRIHFCMRSPEGKDFWGIWTIHEVVEPERLVMSDFFSDADGNVVEPAAYGMPEWPRETRVTVTLEEHAGKTTMTLRHGVPISLAERNGAAEGWSESFDKLAEHLASAG
jgi:uncharacterized protein YndB with AHSA1/START domain